MCALAGLLAGCFRVINLCTPNMLSRKPKHIKKGQWGEMVFDNSSQSRLTKIFFLISVLFGPKLSEIKEVFIHLEY